jgi:hypothetical protein
MEATTPTTEATTEDVAKDTAADVAATVLPKSDVKAVEAKPKAKATRGVAKPKPSKPKTKKVTVNGETVTVPFGLTNDEAVAYAKKLLASTASRKAGTPDGAATPDVERKSTTAKGKPSKTGTTRQTSKVPSGSVRIRLTGVAYEKAITNRNAAAWRKANPVLASALKALPMKKAGGAGYPVYFAIVPKTHVKDLAAFLNTVAKEWDGMDKAPGSPKTLRSNAERMLADAKLAK